MDDGYKGSRQFLLDLKLLRNKVNNELIEPTPNGLRAIAVMLRGIISEVEKL